MLCAQQANTYLRPFSYVSLLSTLIVMMVALCSSSWYTTNVSKGDGVTTRNETTYVGLWNICTGKPELVEHCQFLPPPEIYVSEDYRIKEEDLTAVRALFSMAIMLLLGALGYPPFFKQMSTGVLKIGFMALLTAIGGICSFGSMLIMTHDVNSLPLDVSFGYSYIVGWVGTGMAFISAAVIYVASKDNVYVEKNFN